MLSEFSIISIVIPVYNREKLISETLDSIFIQTFTNWECIIVDDGSTDNTLSVLKKYQETDKRFRFFERPAELKKGAPSCRNYGYQKSEGEYIQWFDSDDLMLPDFLQMKIEKLNNDSSLDFVVSKMGEFHHSNDPSYPSQSLSTENVFTDFINGEISFYTPGPLFTKKFLENKPLFNVDLKRHQEYEFFARLMMHYPKYDIVDSYLCIRRLHGDTINSNANKRFNRYWKVFVFSQMLRYYKKVRTLQKNDEVALLNLISKKSFLYVKISIIELDFTVFSKALYLFLLCQMFSLSRR